MSSCQCPWYFLSKFNAVAEPTSVASYLTNLSCFGPKNNSCALNLSERAKCFSQRQFDQRFLAQDLGDWNAVQHTHNVLREALPDRTQGAVLVVDTSPTLARIAIADVLRRPEATERPLHVAETDLLGGGRQNVAAFNPSVALGETCLLQGPEQLFNVGTREPLPTRNFGSAERLPGGRGSQLQDAAEAVLLFGGDSHRGHLPSTAVCQNHTFLSTIGVSDPGQKA